MSLSFLDVRTTRKPDGSLGYAVYRNNAHTSRYLNAMSHHHLAQKQEVVYLLINRPIYMSDDEYWTRHKMWVQQKKSSQPFTKL